MSSRVVDTLITSIQLVPKGFKGFGNELDTVGKIMSTFVNKGIMLFGLFQQLIFTGGILAGVVLGVAGAFYKAYLDIESTRIAILNTLPTGENFAQVYTLVTDITRDLGLEVEKASRNFLKLNAVLRDSNTTAKILYEIANAVRVIGGSGDDIDKVLINVAQLLSMNRLDGQEFREMANYLPQFNQILMKAFGTISSEQLTGKGIGARKVIETLINELSQMSRVADTPRLAVERLAISFQFLKAKGGELISKVLTPIVGLLTNLFNNLANSDELDKFSDKITAWVEGGGFQKVKDFLIELIVWIVLLPQRFQRALNYLQTWWRTMESSFIILGKVIFTIWAINIVKALIQVVMSIGRVIISLAISYTMMLVNLVAAEKWVQFALVLAGTYAVIVSSMLVIKKIQQDINKLVSEMGVGSYQDPTDGTLRSRIENLINFAVSSTTANLPDEIKLTEDDTLKDIERNTFNTAKRLESSLQDIVVGGRNRLALGYNAVNLDRIKTGRISTRPKHIIADEIEKMVHQIIYSNENNPVNGFRR